MIFICIPAHDEASTIGLLLWKIRRVMAELDRDYRVLVLDDASSDRTPALLESYAKVLPLRVLRSSERLGYSGALERLLRAAADEAPYPKRDCVVTLQGDFTEDPSDLSLLVKTLEGGADIVAGSVRDGESTLPRGVRWTRRLAPLLLGRAHRAAHVSDPLAGFRAYRAIVLRKLFRERGDAPVLRAQGWAANLELLALAAPHARRIEEAQVGMRYDLRARPSRFRSFGTMRALLGVRSVHAAPRASGSPR